MQRGRGGMGSRKHGKSGHTPKSPRFKDWLKRFAERQEHKRKKSQLPYSSVKDYLKDRK